MSLEAYKKGIALKVPPENWIPYVEALPRLSMPTVGKAWRFGRRRPYWYTETGAFVGGGVITRFDADGFEMIATTYKVGKTLFSHQRVKIDLAWDKRSGFDRAIALCPKCNGRREVICLYNKVWHCKICHGVNNFSTRLDRNTREYRRYVDLEYLLRNGKPKGMRTMRYEKLYSDLMALDARWGWRTPRYIQADLQHRVDVTFFGDEDRPKWGERLPEAVSGLS